MSDPLFVFVHGGQHTKACWNPTLEVMVQHQPNVQLLPVNLPGHGDEPGDLASLSIRQCVDSVVANIEALKPEKIVLVGHSMAGITLPGVVERLGAERVQHVVFVACCIPPQGKAVVDTLHMPMSYVARREARKNPVAKPIPKWLASWVFINGGNQEEKQLTYDCLCDESTAVTIEPVDRSNFPRVPMTWVLPLKDRAVKPKLQRQFIENLGGVDKVVEIDTCHNAMVTEPELLAEVLLKL